MSGENANQFPGLLRRQSWQTWLPLVDIRHDGRQRTITAEMYLLQQCPGCASHYALGRNKSDERFQSREKSDRFRFLEEAK